MDLENQKRVKEFAEEYGAENLVVVLGAAEGEAAGLAAETVTLGDPTFAGPLTGVQLGLTTYHVCEPELKEEFDFPLIMLLLLRYAVSLLLTAYYHFLHNYSLIHAC